MIKEYTGTKMSEDISSAVQAEVARLRDMISATKALLPDGKVNFIAYEMAIQQAERAVREQDATSLCRFLPELRSM